MWKESVHLSYVFSYNITLYNRILIKGIPYKAVRWLPQLATIALVAIHAVVDGTKAGRITHFFSTHFTFYTLL